MEGGHNHWAYESLDFYAEISSRYDSQLITVTSKSAAENGYITRI